MRIFGLCLAFVVVVFTSCKSQEESKILKNQYEGLVEFAKVANVIDDDDESYWAYNYADSLLKTIDKSGKSYYGDLSKIYSAYTHIFYGMSYTKTIYALSGGAKHSLAELSNTVIKSSDNEEIDLHKLSKDELASIYSIINFYKVSRMPKYDNMAALFQDYSMESEEMYNNYAKELAYKIVSLNNKKLFYKTLVNLNVDIYLANNPDVGEAAYNKYLDELRRLGGELDKIPSDEATIIALSEKDYLDCLLKSSAVQKSMLTLLTNELKSLKKGNE